MRGGAAYWELRVRVSRIDGDNEAIEDISISLGTYPDISINVAKEAARVARTEAKATGMHPRKAKQARLEASAEAVRQAEASTFRAVAERYLVDRV